MKCAKYGRVSGDGFLHRSKGGDGSRRHWRATFMVKNHGMIVAFICALVNVLNELACADSASVLVMWCANYLELLHLH